MAVTNCLEKPDSSSLWQQLSYRVTLESSADVAVLPVMLSELRNTIFLQRFHYFIYEKRGKTF